MHVFFVDIDDICCLNFLFIILALYVYISGEGVTTEESKQLLDINSLIPQ